MACGGERINIMDRETGRVYSEEELKKMFNVLTLEDAIQKASYIGKKFVPTDKMSKEHLQAAMARKPPKVGRNELCPCGSGKKFKKCCLIKNWRERYGK